MVRSPRSLLALPLTVLLPGVLLAQASGDWPKCNMDSLATWNCGSYYTGTVTMASTLKVSGSEEVSSITATVTAGKVSCQVKGPENPEFTGPGMLVVGHETTGNHGGYEINVWCPEAAGQRPSRRDSPIIVIMKKRATDYTRLDGTESFEHPDADAVNGVTGNVTQTWHLQRR